MTNSDQKNEWLVKRRDVWKKNQKRIAKFDFFCLNIIGEYNYNMKNLDIDDQFIGSYRIEHWMGKRKCWWSIFCAFKLF